MADEQVLPPLMQTLRTEAMSVADKPWAELTLSLETNQEDIDYANSKYPDHVAVSAELVLTSYLHCRERQLAETRTELLSALTRIAEQGEEIARLKLDKNEYKGLFMVAEETVADLRAQVAQRDKKMAELHALIASYNGGAK